MATRHHSLELSETKDVIQLVQDFEEHCHVSLVIAMVVLKTGKTPNLMITMTAYEIAEEPAGPVVLASVEYLSSGTNLRYLKDAVTHGLYMLDGKLAWNEMQKEGNKGA